MLHVDHRVNNEKELYGRGLPGEVTLARQVNGIDLIVGGHTQKPLFQPDIQNGSIIVQAAEWGKYLGRVDLEVLNGKVTLKEAKLIPINLKDSKVKIQADPYIESVLRPYKEKGDSSLSIHLADADAEFVGVRDIVRSQETNLGNLVTDAYKTKVKADLSISNSGGIRYSIMPGKVTYESVLMVLPFGGELAITELTGKELKNYLEFVIFNLTAGSGSFPQMSGVDILASKKTKKIIDLKVNGVKVGMDKKYTMALPEFIAAGGDKYPKLTYRKTGFVDADILKDYVLSKKELKAQDYAPRDYVKYK